MDYILATLLGALIGAALGTGFVWGLMRTKIQTATQEIQSQVAVSSGVLQERLNGKEQLLTELGGRLSKTEADNQQLHIDLQAERVKRSEAEIQNKRIGELQEQLDSKMAEMSKLRSELLDAWTDNARLQEALKDEQKGTSEKISLIEGAKVELSNTFKALSGDILRDNAQSFINLAQSTLTTYQESAKSTMELNRQSIAGLLHPVKESLGRFDSEVRLLEQTRMGAYEGLSQQIRQMLDAHSILRSETNNLVTALRQPQVRGRWGEIQLRRVVEIAGMVEYCDFVEQQSVTLEDGGRQRPDLVVKLPNNKIVIIDSKAPLAAYLEAIEATDSNVRQARLKQHANQIRTHLTSLGKKNYWEAFSSTPEFVVLFLPGEAFFSAALEQDPTLIEMGVDTNVILATPTTLIALLRAVAYGWKQENIAQNALEISKLGRELYKSLSTMTDHWLDVGKFLSKTTQAYNGSLGSLERNVLSKARKFKDLKAADEKVEIDQLEFVEETVRTVVASELYAPEAPVPNPVSLSVVASRNQVAPLTVLAEEATKLVKKEALG